MAWDFIKPYKALVTLELERHFFQDVITMLLRVNMDENRPAVFQAFLIFYSEDRINFKIINTKIRNNNLSINL